MVRPTNKDDLLLLSQSNYEKIISTVDTIPIEKQFGTFPFEDRDRNIRDVLIHLYEWHQLYLNWTEQNTTNKEIFPFIPAPYNWKTYPLMNIEFWKKHQSTDFNVAKKLLDQSHHQVMKRITQFSNEELYTKNFFSWTGSAHLASVSISATSSHYDWAFKKIKKYKKLMIL
ncbi:ClbS/DfsB family four-helix bundle protein [Commensalibacter papalotli (ex Servin-Garciduenas et al. 2014)]|uniref:ClbS/DfsB family four-helix bundle protein n=1 Tax=Commensalibacter papalotli (ex Servin-Garciduenas et al. 2014) TaxID=1208583 RepID=W7DWF6_9PROT|nr:ClbS/DfsB family four-helix bundle protein [Commensalibacter papalotli (ex Servin-Garciduenas et al. 2014)]EUK18553.1 hypothetical protein COMX_02355 [Commensalibacter papalotli (ex Servin-Garciduenas et al. 2014)]